METDEWVKETQRRAGLVARFFEPKENLVIQDFVVTATDVSKVEKD